MRRKEVLFAVIGVVVGFVVLSYLFSINQKVESMSRELAAIEDRLGGSARYSMRTYSDSTVMGKLEYIGGRLDDIDGKLDEYRR